MNFPGGFRPSSVYDGVLQRSNDELESCLCPFDKWAWWKNKSGAIRHLRKVWQIGVAPILSVLLDFLIRLHLHSGHECVYYSSGEITNHHCVPPKNRAIPAIA